MTDEQWKASTDQTSLLEFIGSRASERKLQLFAAACCRRVWHLLTDPRHRDAVKAAERFADGLLAEAEFERVRQLDALWAQLPDARVSRWEPVHYMTQATRHLGSSGGAVYAAGFAARGLACLAGEEGSPAFLAALQAEEVAQCELLRDLFGDPSRPFRFDPAWLAGEGRPAVAQARVIYREGSFRDLPLLGGVLGRLGCRDKAVLEHCERPGPHARGCWVVDALLGHETAVRTGLVLQADWQTCGDPEPLRHFLRDRGSRRKWRLFAVACCRRISHLYSDERSRRAVEVAARYADHAATDAELDEARTAAQQAEDEATRAEYVAEGEVFGLEYAAEGRAELSPDPAFVAARRRWYAANREVFAASAFRSAVGRDPRVTDAEPGTHAADWWRPSDASAAEVVSQDAYADVLSKQGDARWEAARDAADAARAAELRYHCDLLRDLFGGHLGPPGEEGAWLPFGLYAAASPLSQAEQWCLLPTPRRVELRPEWLAWDGGTVPRLAQEIYQEEAFDRLPILADALEKAGCSDPDLLGHLRGPGPHVRGCVVLDLLLGKE